MADKEYQEYLQYLDYLDSVGPKGVPFQPTTPVVQEPRKFNAFQRGAGALAMQGQGAFGNLMDEANAGLTALPAYLGNRWEGGTETLGGIYDEKLAKNRKNLSEFKEAYPAISSGNEMIGGFGQAALASRLVPGGAGLVSSPIVRSAIGGGLSGATYGFGGAEGGFVNRAIDAGITGGVGAGTGLALGVGVEGAKALAKSNVGQSAINAVKSLFGKEPTPVLNTAGKNIARDLTGEGILPEDISRASTKMGRALERGDDVFLPEVIDDPQLYQDARYYSNTRGGRKIAQSAIKDRTNLAETRVSSAIDSLSPADDAFESGRVLRGKAEEAIKAVKQQRRDITAPLYKKALEEKPILNSNKIKQLMSEEDNLLTGMVKRLKRDFPEFKNEPANSSKMLNEVLGELNDDIGKALPSEQRRLLALKETLESEVERLNPSLKLARKAYEATSKSVDKYERPMMAALKDLSDEKLELAGDKIFKLPVNKIGELKKMLGGEKEVQDAVAAHIRQTFQSTSGAKSFTTNKLVNNKHAKQKLLEIFGQTKYKQFARAMNLEESFVQGAKEYSTGSTTQTNQATRWEKIKSVIPYSAHLQRVGKALGGGGGSVEEAKEAAKILFSTKGGKEYLYQLGPHMSEQEMINKLAKKFATGTGVFAGQETERRTR